MKFRMLVLLACSVACSDLFAQHTEVSDNNFLGKLQSVLIRRIDTLKTGVGITVGFVSGSEVRVARYGNMDRDQPNMISDTTLFELGDITRIFTTLLLVDMAGRNEVGLDDPVNKYLPRQGRIPVTNHRPVTLLDLALNTSGLPFLPPEIERNNPQSLAEYDDKLLFKFLHRFKGKKDSANVWVNSQLGTGLLGIALSRAAGKPYQVLIRERITDPLGMKKTIFRVHGKDTLAMAKGYNEKLKKAPPISSYTLESSNSLKSTAADMLLFVNAFLHVNNTPLGASMRSMFDHRIRLKYFDQSIGWLSTRNSSDHIQAFAGGKTWGFCSFMIFDLEKDFGAIVLSNSSHDLNDITLKLLDRLPAGVR